MLILNWYIRAEYNAITTPSDISEGGKSISEEQKEGRKEA